MQSSRQLLASIAKNKGWRYNRIAKELGQSRERLDEIRNGQQCLTEDQAAQVAALLDLNPLYVLACVRAERAKRKGLKTLWERIARGATAVTVLLCLSIGPELLSYLTL